jgi:Protein kinase domain
MESVLLQNILDAIPHPVLACMSSHGISTEPDFANTTAMKIKGVVDVTHHIFRYIPDTADESSRYWSILEVIPNMVYVFDNKMSRLVYCNKPTTSAYETLDGMSIPIVTLTKDLSGIEFMNKATKDILGDTPGKFTIKLSDSRMKRTSTKSKRALTQLNLSNMKAGSPRFSEDSGSPSSTKSSGSTPRLDFDHLHECNIVTTLFTSTTNEVYLIRLDGTLLVAKVDKIEGTVPPAAMHSIEHEYSCLSKLQHPGIIKTFGIRMLGSQRALILEYCPAGSLDTVLKRVDDPLPEVCIVELLGKLFQALEYIHGERILHRDIKPSNVLIDKDFHPKFADFGTNKRLLDGDTSNTVVGSIHYMSPEMMESKEHSSASDIWSMGILAIELMDGKPLFANCGTLTIVKAIVNDHMKPQPRRRTAYSRRLTKLVDRMVNHNPSERPTASDCLAHLKSKLGWDGSLKNFGKVIQAVLAK